MPEKKEHISTEQCVPTKTMAIITRRAKLSRCLVVKAIGSGFDIFTLEIIIGLARMKPSVPSTSSTYRFFGKRLGRVEYLIVYEGNVLPPAMPQTTC
jgi:hypothetical protein